MSKCIVHVHPKNLSRFGCLSNSDLFVAILVLIFTLPEKPFNSSNFELLNKVFGFPYLLEGHKSYACEIIDLVMEDELSVLVQLVHAVC